MTSTEGTTTSQASEPSETTTVDSNQVDIAEEMPDPSAQGSDNEASGESDDIEETPENSVNEGEGTEALLDNEQTAIKLSCVKNGIEYMNGDNVYHENPCKLCQCINGEIVCVTEECVVPDASDNCMKIDPAPRVCCPTYECLDTTITAEDTSSNESGESGLETTSMPTTSEGIADSTEAGTTTSETSGTGAETEEGTTITTESDMTTTEGMLETSTSAPSSTTLADGDSEETEADATTVTPTSTTMTGTSSDADTDGGDTTTEGSGTTLAISGQSGGGWHSILTHTVSPLMH